MNTQRLTEWVWGSILSMISAIAILAVAPRPAFATFPGENGRIAYRGLNNVISLTDSGQLTFPLPGIYDFAPAFSPDGSQVSFIRQVSITDGYSYTLYVVKTDGTGLRPVTSSTSFPGLKAFFSISNPAWSADGKRISFAVRGSGQLGYDGIWTIGPEGLIKTVSGDVNFPNWSPAGNTLLYTCSFRTNTSGVRVTDLCEYDPSTGGTSVTD